MEKYREYGIEDFVLDNAFVHWVRFPSNQQNEEWERFLTEHPEKRNEIEKAKLVVRSLEPIELPVPSDRLNAVWQRLDKKRRIKLIRFNPQFLKYAAVFLLAFLTAWGGFYFLTGEKQNYSQVYNEVKVPYGQRSEMTLYDGTKVWLNSGTELKFPLVFSGDQRKVYVKGEAFFDVARDAAKPFIVNAGQMDIEVLGTRFDVCAYPDDEELNATLEEGEIRAVNPQTEEKVHLLPGSQVILNRGSQKFLVQQVDTRLYTSWKENMLRLENATFSDVVKKMERWYDVRIHVDEQVDSEERYTMTIKTESLREMLRLVSFTTPLNYEIKENQVFIKRTD